MDAAQRARLLRLARMLGAVLAGGLAYAGLCVWAGGPVLRCPFRAVTGLLCPGCGISRLCLALLRGDLPAAFRANAALLLLLPLLLALGARLCWGYVRTGRWALTGPWLRLTWAAAGVLLAFALWRDLAILGLVAPPLGMNL